MKQKLAILLIAIGIFTIGWNVYHWYVQADTVTANSQQARSIDANWHNTVMQTGISDLAQEVKQDDEELNEGDEIGTLTIPKLEKIYPIYFGTDQETLEDGTGLYDTPYTVLPNQNGHTAIAGHRDTVFIGLDELEDGDRLYITFNHTKYEYQIRKTWVTNAEDRTVIVEKEEPTLTLTTCYPFDFVGPAPDRYIVESELISKETLK
ncbi:LPXTG-site transpeptidase family protein [Gracilibacillus halophilus YIM-C55.5]|uniref:LPXTG-site transpeptidase family protein n=1 Tax=Gracilibacillus halophilus YIM-C55.5 TaxID=1308866 RepID=N4WU44_9BACI|nr:class D sortase [Gracilibacillus halophilus]ENH96626.1 LPXTG-site transpeptidase family protein [Gracilibacillus halophilus YIM-C55.5]